MDILQKLEEMPQLESLPHEHPLRNKPLIDIGAHYRNKDSKVWNKIKPSYGIAKATYNQLGDCWKQHDIWKATVTV